MKVLRGILSVIISLVIMVLFSLLITSFLFENLIQNQLVGNVVKTEMITEMIDKSDIENKDEIVKMLDDKKLDEIVNDVIEDYMDAINEGRTEVSEKTINNIIDYAADHKAELEKITNEKIDINEIKSQESHNELARSLNEVLEETDKLGTTEKDVLKAYAMYTSSKFRLVLIVIIIVLIGLLMLIKKSYYKWLSSVGGALIGSGIFVCIAYSIIDLILRKFANEPSIHFSLNVNNILIVGIFEISIGLALIITKSIIKKYTTNKTEENEQV